MGINELRVVIRFGLSIAELVSGLSNGLSLEELAQAANVVAQIPSVIQDAGNAWEEYLNLTDAESADVNTFVQTEFHIPETEVQDVVEKGIQIALAAHELIGIFLKH